MWSVTIGENVSDVLMIMKRPTAIRSLFRWATSLGNVKLFVESAARFMHLLRLISSDIKGFEEWMWIRVNLLLKRSTGSYFENRGNNCVTRNSRKYQTNEILLDRWRNNERKHKRAIVHLHKMFHKFTNKRRFHWHVWHRQSRCSYNCNADKRRAYTLWSESGTLQRSMPR